MQLSGQTPLFRAKKLEQYLGIENVYFKLEGLNPTGHKNDRIAEVLVKAALTNNYHKVLVHGSERYLQSILYFASKFGLEVHAPYDKNEDAKPKKHSDVNWHNIVYKTPETRIEIYEAFAEASGMFFLSEWEKKPFIRGLAIQKLMEEIISRMEGITTVWTQGQGGYTVKSIHQELMRSWVNDSIESIPELHCGLDTQVYRAMNDLMPIKGYTKDKLELLSEALSSTKAQIHDISSEDLKEAVRLIKKLENITISLKEAYSLAAFIKGKPTLGGNHIIILNDGKSDIEITEVSKNPNLDFDEILNNTRKLLEPYHDSIEETSDAIRKAIDVGYILVAKRKDEIQGICIVVHMGFTDFIPSYHLAYIGVKKGNSGRGLATELINVAIDKTKGNISLHVDIPNRRAKKLYEKMGFVHTYDRMLYKG